MRVRHAFPLLLPLLLPVLAFAEKNNDPAPGAAVINELNIARRNPVAYATYFEQMRKSFNGRYFVLPSGARFYSHEGVTGLDEAISYLHSAQAVQPLTLSPGMCRGTADHCSSQAGGAIGHGNNPDRRISRYGKWAGCWGENISYGKSNARDVVIALILDDNVRDRGHRHNIFAAKFNYAGAAFGPHARYGSMCSIDFAGMYLEKSGASLVAGN